MVNGAATLRTRRSSCGASSSKTGKVAWEKKNVGKYHAAIVRCGEPGKERLLMLDDAGVLTLFEAEREGVQGTRPVEGVRRDLGAPRARGRPRLPARQRRN